MTSAHHSMMSSNGSPQDGPRVRTGRTWAAACVVGVGIGIAVPVLLFFLPYVNLVVGPMLWLLVLVGSLVCFLVGIDRPRAFAFGVSLLISLPVSIAVVWGFVHCGSR